MSFSGQAILALHIAAAIFALGPGTAAIMSTPRYIRKGNVAVVGYLYRTTRIYAIGSALVLVFGLILAQIQHEFSQWWVSVSITLYVVAAVLLLLIMRDQRKALAALKSASSQAAVAPSTAVLPAAHARQEPGSAQAPTDRSGEDEEEIASDGEQAATTEADAAESSTAESSAVEPSAPAPASAPAESPALAPAAVERARISSLSGVIALIWLVTLVLMVWK